MDRRFTEAGGPVPSDLSSLGPDISVGTWTYSTTMLVLDDATTGVHAFGATVASGRLTLQSDAHVFYYLDR